MTSITRRSLLSASALLAVSSLAACGGGSSEDDSTLTVAASPSPHAEILSEFAAPLLAEQGYTLEVKEYTDYILPNQDTTSGEVDCNYFQHLNYLNNYNEENGTDLVSVGKIHFEPMGVFAGKSDDLAAIADGATITASPSPAPPVASISNVFAWLSTSTSFAPSIAAIPLKLFTSSVTPGRNVFGSDPNFMQP